MEEKLKSAEIKTFEEILNSKLSAGKLKATYVYGKQRLKEICEAAEEYKSQFSSVADEWQDGIPPYDGKFLCFIRQPQECGNIWEYQRVVDCIMNVWSLLHDETVIRWRFLPENPILQTHDQ